jgi:hypothetical protein
LSGGLNTDTLALTAAVIVYALIDSRDATGEHLFGDAVEVYLDRKAAEQGLSGIIRDEPGWEPFMSLVEIELTTGNSN